MLNRSILRSAERHSSRIAVQMGEHSLTYKQLIDKASAVAGVLQRQALQMELKEGQPACGLLFNQGISGIVGIIACVLSGIVYVPLDATYPRQRLLNMASHAGIRLILTDYSLLNIGNELSLGLPTSPKVAVLEELSVSTNEQVIISESVDPRVYLLYTSGSTGSPKAVIQHAVAIAHFAEAYINELKIFSEDRLTLFSTYGHDAAMVDIFAALLSGACLYPLDLHVPENLLRLSGWLSSNNITVWHSVPTLFRSFITSSRHILRVPALRLVVLGGEAVRGRDYVICDEKLPNVDLYSLYGQTESSYSAGSYVHDCSDSVTIGLPIVGTQLLLAHLEGEFIVINDTEVGIQRTCSLLKDSNIPAGELLVASNFVAEGYWNDYDATSQAFLDSNVFGRVYRTGDFAEFTNDGRLVFRGRKDSQVKIRGYRIEIGEIESQILSIEGVRECVVISSLLEGETVLIGFIQANQEISKHEVNEYLMSLLPAYMRLSKVIMLDSFPRTLTGKIDRKQLLVHS